MEKLFTEFKSITAAEWKTQLEKDLKGLPFADLIWHNENGFDIQPFYTAEDLKQKYYPAFNHSDWLICASAKGKSTAEKNASLLKALAGGASSIWVENTEDLENLLKGIQLDYIRSSFVVNEDGLKQLHAFLEKNYKGVQLQLSIFLSGTHSALNTTLLKKISEEFKSNQKCSSISVDATSFHNRNCTAAYELALIFGMFVEQLESFGTAIPSTPIVIKTGVNSDFFTQIAKLRAIHRLFAVFSKEYNIKNDLHLCVESSLVNKTVSDRYNNLLRTTVEAMAAVAGGCNELLLLDFDVLTNEHSPLAQRMSVNQQLILKDESYLDQFADISCGSYFIESLTDQLATEALSLFKKMENAGGFYASQKSGEIDKEIAAQSKLAAEPVNSGSQVVIGVNKFRNEKENMVLDKITKDFLKNLKIQNPALQYELQNTIS